MRKHQIKNNRKSLNDPTSSSSICIVGLGYVGITLGLTLAEVGFEVFGLDVNIQLVNNLALGKMHIKEFGILNLLTRHNGKNFRVANSLEEENNCSVYIVCVGTPVGKFNKPDLNALKESSKLIGVKLKKSDLVILRSTLPIGATRSVVVPILEKKSGLVAGKDFFVSFAPERTIEGKALEELRKLPQVIGGFDKKSTEETEKIFRKLTPSVVLVDSLEEAEIVKLVNNTYRDVTFAFANELSLISRSWKLNTRRVIEAANAGYERSRVPMPSPGVGGYCLTKDPIIFIESAKDRGYEPKLFRIARNVSDKMIESIARDIFSFLKKSKISRKLGRVLILGFAFKGRPTTADVRGSTTNDLIRIIKDGGINAIAGHDPNVAPEDIIRAGAKPLRRLPANARAFDVVVVMTNAEAFESVNMNRFLSRQVAPTFLFDAWGLFSKLNLSKLPLVEYICL